MRRSISPQLKLKARALRVKGFSVPEISEQCGISKSTALRYIHDVSIHALSIPRWLERRNASKIISERQRKLAIEKADQIMKNPNSRILAIATACLYWAEGSKKDLSFSNSDPDMIAFFIRTLQNLFLIPKERIVVSLRLYEDLNKNKCLAFWTKTTGIRLNNHTSITVLSGFKRGKLEYGMCRVRVRKGGLLLKEFSAIISHVKTL